jgi:hypothetical protein
VEIKAWGLSPNLVHAQHIHGVGSNECPGKEARNDRKADGLIDTTEGLPAYGPIMVSLTTKGDTSPASALAVNRFPSTGDFTYQRTIKVTDNVAKEIRRDNAVVVVHGIDYNGNGVYDGTLGGSELNPGLVGEATAPGLCGELLAGRSAQQSADRKLPDAGRVYTASLGAPPAAPALICHLS